MKVVDQADLVMEDQEIEGFAENGQTFPYPVVCHRAESSTQFRLRRQDVRSSQEDLAKRMI